MSHRPVVIPRGKLTLQSRLSPECLDALQDAFDEYVYQIELSGLRPFTQRAYITLAQRFLRWLHGENVNNNFFGPPEDIDKRA